MRIGICCGLDALSDAAEAGYAYAEMAITPIALMDDAEYARLREAVLAVPISVEAFNCFIPGDLKVTGPKVDSDTLCRYMHTALGRAAELGGEIMVFGSGGARSVPDGWPVEKAWAQFDAAARMAAEVASGYGITVVLEPLCKRGSNLLNRVDEGAAMVDRIRHPRLRLLTDLFHITEEEEPFANIIAAGGRFAHIHLATPAIPETKDGFAYDFPGFLNALVRIGYIGRVSVEDNPGFLAGKQPPFTAVFRAIRVYVESCLPMQV